MYRLSFLLVVLSLVLSNMPLAQADTSHLFTVEADARVEADHPTDTFGTRPTIAADGKPHVEGFLRFGVIQLGGIIQQATLRLWAVSGAGTLPSVALASGNWDEYDVTWNTRPQPTTARLAFSGATRPGRWVSFDVSPLLRGTSNGAYTFVLTTERADQLALSSREGLHAAELIVETTSQPQPTASPTTGAAPAAVASPTPAPPSSTASPTVVPPGSAGGTTWYVAPSGTNGTGHSWDNAWNTFAAIQWGLIEPGDTVRIARGTYRESLVVSAQGSTKEPIHILFEPGSVLFGGRSAVLSGCGQPPTSSSYGQKQAIDLHAAAYVIVDGQEWNGLNIHGWQRGIAIGSAHGVTLRNMEITDNGYMLLENGSWYPNSHGITMDAARDVLFEQMNLHDNGADGIHAHDTIAHITVRNTWFHNDRGERFNGCKHPDGLQINTGFTGSSITFERVVSGPNVYHTMLSNTGGEGWRFEDVLAFKPLTSTFACRGACRNLTFNRVTSDAGDSPLNVELAGTGHRITNSLITNGTNRLPSDTALANNYQWDLNGTRMGTTKDPQYQNPQQGDYTPRAHVNGAGSTVTSAAQLIKAAAPTSALRVSP